MSTVVDTPESAPETPSTPIYRHEFRFVIFTADPDWAECLDDETGGEDIGMEADQGVGFHALLRTTELSGPGIAALERAGYEDGEAEEMYAHLIGTDEEDDEDEKEETR